MIIIFLLTNACVIIISYKQNSKSVTLNIKSCSKDYLPRLFRTSDKRALPALRASISRLLRRGTASFLSDAYAECATRRALICAEYKIHLTHSHAFRHVVVGGGIAVRKVPTVFLITFPASALYEPAILREDRNGFSLRYAR